MSARGASPGLGGVPPPTSPAAEIECWCARNGRTRAIGSEPSNAGPLCTRVRASAFRGSMAGGSTAGAARHRLAAAGRATMNNFVAPAAATSSARRSAWWPRSWRKSSRASSGARAGSRRRPPPAGRLLPRLSGSARSRAGSRSCFEPRVRRSARHRPRWPPHDELATAGSARRLCHHDGAADPRTGLPARARRTARMSQPLAADLARRGEHRAASARSQPGPAFLSRRREV